MLVKVMLRLCYGAWLLCALLDMCIYMLLEDTDLILAGHTATGSTKLLQPHICQAV